ncbi:hypothetical protein Tco_1372858, partial [Tanacetum coccineum]
HIKHLRVKVQNNQLNPNQHPLLLTLVQETNPLVTDSSSSHNTIQDSKDSLEDTNGSKGTQVQSSHDSPLSGDHTSEKAEGGLKLEELFVLCTNLSNKVLALETSKDAQAAEILKLKDQIKKLKRKCNPSISHHIAWLKSVKRLSMKKRDYIETEDFVKEGRQSNETGELNKGHGEKGGSAKELVSTAVPKIVSTARLEISTVRPDVDAARQEDNAVEPRTPPTTTSIFNDEDITMAQTLSKMKEEKAKEKVVSIKDIENSSRHIARDVEIARQLQVDLQAEVERERQREEEASKAAIAKPYDELKQLLLKENSEATQRSAEIRKIQGLYERQKRVIDDFKPMDSDDAVKDSKEAVGVHKQKVFEEPNSTKLEVKQEGYEESVRKRLGKRLKMKATKKSKRQKKHGVECIYYRIFRSDGSFRWIKTFSEMVTSVHTLILEDGTEIHMLAERKYPLIKETLERMFSLSMEAMMEVRRILKCWFDHHTTNGHRFTMSNRHQELTSPEQTASALAIPEQTTTGKEISNPFSWCSCVAEMVTKDWKIKKFKFTK